MQRLEDQGLTLRLFRDMHDAKSNSDIFSAFQYGNGALGKDKLGRWVDAHGVLPLEWVPNEKLLTISQQHGYFVDHDGHICCADVAPRGCHFSIVEKESHREIWIVKDTDGEVIDEYVLWSSLEDMSANGVDTTYRKNRKTNQMRSH